MAPLLLVAVLCLPSPLLANPPAEPVRLREFCQQNLKNMFLLTAFVAAGAAVIAPVVRDERKEQSQHQAAEKLLSDPQQPLVLSAADLPNLAVNLRQQLQPENAYWPVQTSSFLLEQAKKHPRVREQITLTSSSVARLQSLTSPVEYEKIGWLYVYGSDELYNHANLERTDFNVLLQTVLEEEIKANPGTPPLDVYRQLALRAKDIRPFFGQMKPNLASGHSNMQIAAKLETLADSLLTKQSHAIRQILETSPADLDAFRIHLLQKYRADASFKDLVDFMGASRVAGRVSLAKSLAIPSGLNAFLGEPDSQGWPTHYPSKVSEKALVERREMVDRLVHSLLTQWIDEKAVKQANPSLIDMANQALKIDRRLLEERTEGLPSLYLEVEALLRSGSDFSWIPNRRTNPTNRRLTR